jgi:D-alanyl-D-alanine carboxypeptidase (penicillin-binding protein 5/6)
MMDGALSGKTGFTGDAGYCYVGALKKDGKTFVVALLACGWPSNKSYKWSDTKKIMKYGLNNYSIVKMEDVTEFNPIMVIDGQIEQVNVKADAKNIELLLGNDETTKVECDLPDTLMAPVRANEQIGSVKYYVNDELYDEAPIYTIGSVDKIDYQYCLDLILDMWTLH